MLQNITDKTAISIEGFKSLTEEIVNMLKKDWAESTGNGLPESIVTFYDHVQIEYLPIVRRTMLEYLDEVLDCHMELTLLYVHARSESTDYGQTACLYFKPALGRLIKLDVSSDSEGRVSRTLFTAFLEADRLYGEMLYDIKTKLTIGRFVELRKKRELMADFC